MIYCFKLEPNNFGLCTFVCLCAKVTRMLLMALKLRMKRLGPWPHSNSCPTRYPSAAGMERGGETGEKQRKRGRTARARGVTRLRIQETTRPTAEQAAEADAQYHNM